MIFLQSVEPYFVARVVTKISSCRVIVVCRQSEAVMEPPNPKKFFFITSRAIISGFMMITAVRLY